MTGDLYDKLFIYPTDRPPLQTDKHSATGWLLARSVSSVYIYAEAMRAAEVVCFSAPKDL